MPTTNTTKTIGSIIKDFKDFVATHETEKGGPMTHTTYDFKRYNFVDDDYQKFLEKYVAVIKSGAGIDLHFVERPNSNGVTYLLIDVDYEHEGSKRLYKKKHIKQIIENINDFLRDNFTVTKHQLTSFVTEKEIPSKRDNNSLYKDGFHICYPYLPMEEKHRY
jgi:hypothetical protein